MLGGEQDSRWSCGISEFGFCWVWAWAWLGRRKQHCCPMSGRRAWNGPKCCADSRTCSDMAGHWQCHIKPIRRHKRWPTSAVLAQAGHGLAVQKLVLDGARRILLLQVLCKCAKTKSRRGPRLQSSSRRIPGFFSKDPAKG